MPGLTSASGVLGFLSDEEPELKVFALQTLNDDIDTLWTEVAGSIGQMWVLSTQAMLLVQNPGIWSIMLTCPFSEALYEDETFPERQLASLVLAKVYYHLSAYNESMTFALGAGDLFKLDNEGEFEETIISRCVDTYISVSAARHAAPKKAAHAGSLPTLETSFAAGSEDATAAAALSPTTPFSQSTLPSKSLLSRPSIENVAEVSGPEGKSTATAIPDDFTEAALQKVIERLFESCLQEGRYRQVVGIAVEAQNLEVLRRVIKRASDDEKKSRGKQVDAEGTPGPTEELMEYVLDICMGVVQERSLRSEILRLILDLLNEIPSPDYFSIAKCVVYLNQDEEASTMLKKLVVCAICFERLGSLLTICRQMVTKLPRQLHIR
jgi:26S proteasome regulatory subunit N2